MKLIYLLLRGHATEGHSLLPASAHLLHWGILEKDKDRWSGGQNECFYNSNTVRLKELFKSTLNNLWVSTSSVIKIYSLMQFKFSVERQKCKHCCFLQENIGNWLQPYFPLPKDHQHLKVFLFGKGWQRYKSYFISFWWSLGGEIPLRGITSHNYDCWQKFLVSELKFKGHTSIQPHHRI